MAFAVRILYSNSALSQPACWPWSSYLNSRSQFPYHLKIKKKQNKKPTHNVSGQSTLIQTRPRFDCSVRKDKEKKKTKKLKWGEKNSDNTFQCIII